MSVAGDRPEPDSVSEWAVVSEGDAVSDQDTASEGDAVSERLIVSDSVSRGVSNV